MADFQSGIWTSVRSGFVMAPDGSSAYVLGDRGGSSGNDVYQITNLGVTDYHPTNVTTIAGDAASPAQGWCSTTNRFGWRAQLATNSQGDLYAMGFHDCWMDPPHYTSPILRRPKCDSAPCDEFANIAVSAPAEWANVTNIDDPAFFAVHKKTGDMYMSSEGTMGPDGGILKITPDGTMTLHAGGPNLEVDDYNKFSVAGPMAVDEANGDLYVLGPDRILKVAGNCVATPAEPCGVSVVWDSKWTVDPHSAATQPAQLEVDGTSTLAVKDDTLYVGTQSRVYHIPIFVRVPPSPVLSAVQLSEVPRR
jgi:hypothetical protein